MMHFYVGAFDLFILDGNTDTKAYDVVCRRHHFVTI